MAPSERAAEQVPANSGQWRNPTTCRKAVICNFALIVTGTVLATASSKEFMLMRHGKARLPASERMSTSFGIGLRVPIVHNKSEKYLMTVASVVTLDPAYRIADLAAPRRTPIAMRMMHAQLYFS
jgi:hypothetical protein